MRIVGSGVRRFYGGWLVLAGGLLVGCGGSSGETTAEVVETTVTTGAVEVADAATTTSVDQGAEAETGLKLCEGCAAGVVDPSWEMLEGEWFVHDLEAGAVLDIRAEPRFEAGVVGELTSEATGIRIYDHIEDNWRPISIGDGAGWIPDAFLRPHAAVADPIVVGDVPAEVAELAESIVQNRFDGSTLSTVVGPEGLRLSLDGAVTVDDPTVEAALLADPTAQAIDWGFTPEGETVFLTLDERLHDLAGSTAITSTEQIGLDQTLAVGDPVGNLAEVFPDAHVVEYHFSGTSSTGGHDWASVRLVIDVSGGDPVLLAIVEDAGPA